MSREASARGSILYGPPKPRTSTTPDFRQEPGAGKPHAGICAGGGRELPSLPRQESPGEVFFHRASNAKRQPSIPALLEKSVEYSTTAFNTMAGSEIW